MRLDVQVFPDMICSWCYVGKRRMEEEWRNFYNYHRPHSALAGVTPYEMLREKLNLNVAEARVE